MRYQSGTDGQMLRRACMGPVLATQRRNFNLVVPGRGIYGYSSRQTLRGFGAAATGLAPPVGAGTGAGASIGASQGAAIGSAIVPGIGTAIGAVVGAIGGAIAGSIDKKDPEQYNFDAAVSLWQQNPNAVYSIGNKYLPIAGLFDLTLRNAQIPIYNRYNRQAGRGGEEKFTHDLAMQVYQAAQSGQIGSQDTAQTVFNKVIQPWINSWGYPPMNDPHQDLINRLMVGMIMDYVTGAAPQVWRARGGDLPASFSSIPAFSLITPTSSATPSPQPVGGPETNTVAIPPVGTLNSPSIISTTPPAIGAPLPYAMDASTGKMIALPAGATFGGLNPNGQWLVIYSSGANAGTYIVFGGALTPYFGSSGNVPAVTSSATPAQIPPGFTKSTQTAVISGTTFPLYADNVGNLYIWSGTQMVPYQTAASSALPNVTSASTGGGGGGGFFDVPPVTAPTASASVPVSAPTGIDPTLLLGGAALLAYLLMGR
jgi:hypothetical protein